MSDIGLWKYFTSEHHREFLLSLRLLGETALPAERQLRCLYAVANHTERHYTAHSIPRQGGGTRELLSPDPLLAKIQRGILRGALEGLPVSPHATAYYKGANILGNARPHLGASRVLSMDIRDFFASIPYVLVYRSAFPRVFYPSSVATLLANLCCCNDYLPQGAPTSAAVSNLVMRPFDEHIGAWCGQRGIAYTRYCDDMTFSGDFDPAPVIAKVRGFLFSMGFELNREKTRVRERSARQSVTGIVVNERPRVPRRYRDRLRQELYYCETYGVASHLQHMNDARWLPAEPPQLESYLRSLSGRVEYVLQVDPQNRSFLRARERVRELLRQTADTEV